MDDCQAGGACCTFDPKFSDYQDPNGFTKRDVIMHHTKIVHGSRAGPKVVHHHHHYGADVPGWWWAKVGRTGTHPALVRGGKC